LKQATLDEKKELEGYYQLTLSSKYLPEEMDQLLKMVNLKLSSSPLAKEIDTASNKKEGQYLVAFHTGKLKR
jgi:hypothetical protein